NFWDDPQEAQKIVQQAKHAKDKIKEFTDLEQKYEDLLALLEMAMEEEDESLEKDLQNDYEILQKDLDRLTVATLLAGEYDR
ncbi:PCRF domain-containing protein, partial [Klebsiella pneumoniae]|uniref:PCRF domain-containing protein n=1 Tax=Klebsiella pneumoniae TaxID=573 RepID=UPI0027305F30